MGIIVFQAGLEGEFIFPFNRNKWSALAEFSYFQYEDEKESTFLSVLTRPNFIEYSAIELNVWARHSFFVSNDLRFFLNINYIVPFNLEQSLDRVTGEDFDEFVNLSNLGFGGGLEWNRFNLNFLYQFSRTLINGAPNKYDSYSVSLGYSFF